MGGMKASQSPRTPCRQVTRARQHSLAHRSATSCSPLKKYTATDQPDNPFQSAVVDVLQVQDLGQRAEKSAWSWWSWLYALQRWLRCQYDLSFRQHCQV